MKGEWEEGRKAKMRKKLLVREEGKRAKQRPPR